MTHPVIFRAGGALMAEHDAAYIERTSDTEALNHLLLGDYVLVIEPRQQGKTSLVHRLRRHPALVTTSFVYIDLTSLNRATEAAWYQSLCPRILAQLREFIARDRQPAIPADLPGWRDFLAAIAQAATSAGHSVVVVLDEVGAVKFPGATDFFSVIRDVYNSRQFEEEFKQLVFLLVGAFNPRDLIEDESISPFNVAQQVRLPDFTLDQVGDLVGRGGWPVDQTSALAGRIHEWTSGQPYMTQRICLYLGAAATPADVDAAVERLRREDKNHLPPLMRRLNQQPDLDVYLRRVLAGERIKFYPDVHAEQAELELIGIIKADAAGFCQVRNRIYQEVLGRDEQDPAAPGAGPAPSGTEEARAQPDAVRGGGESVNPLGATRDARPSTAAPQHPLTGPIQKRWALLVGVNRYIDYPRLNFCVNDVLALEALLNNRGYTVVCMHDNLQRDDPRFPTRINIVNELTRLREIVEQDDLLLVHVACHGLLRRSRPWLVVGDTRYETLADTGLPLVRIERLMRQSPARRLIITLDACHSGVEMGRGLTDPRFIRKAHELAEGFALIAASTAQQRAQEWGAQQHGVFTYYLLEGLSGCADQGPKGYVTINDLSTYIMDRMKTWNVQHGGLIQEPTARIEGMGDMILVVKPNRLTSTAGIAPNPFGDVGRITDQARFFDREDLLSQVLDELGRGMNISLVGPSQVGKSSLLATIQALGAQHPRLKNATFAQLNLQMIENEDEFYQALCDTLGIGVCRGYALVRALQGRKVVLCLDELEVLKSTSFTLEVRRRLRGLADGAGAPLKLVTASRQPLAHLFPDSPEQDSPLAGICRQIDVGPFSPAIARAFMAARLRNTGVEFSEEQVARLVEVSGGNPGLLQRAAAELHDQLTQRR